MSVYSSHGFHFPGASKGLVNKQDVAQGKS